MVFDHNKLGVRSSMHYNKNDHLSLSVAQSPSQLPGIINNVFVTSVVQCPEFVFFWFLATINFEVFSA